MMRVGLIAELDQPSPQAVLERAEQAVASTGRLGLEDGPLGLFEEAHALFLGPDAAKLQAVPAAPPPPQRAARGARRQASQVDRHPPEGGAAQGNEPSGVPQHLDLMQQELTQPWQVSLMHVQAMQQAWGQSLVEWYKCRAKTLHHQVTPRDVQATVQELRSEQLLSLAVSTCMWAYHACVLTSAHFPQSQVAAMSRTLSAASHAALAAADAVAMTAAAYDLAFRPAQPARRLQGSPAGKRRPPRRGRGQVWDERRRAYRRTTVGSNFTLPVVMLSLRFLLRKSFCKSFPHWTASEDGLRSLQQMKAALVSSSYAPSHQGGDQLPETLNSVTAAAACRWTLPWSVGWTRGSIIPM
eukprot:jgi/Astpho2/7826/fgenesh1_pg.00117_%23_36_t